jgi:hypothetical protein
MVRYAAGLCARARRELVSARVATERGLDLARRGGLRLDTVYGLLSLMELARLDGDRAHLRDLHERAERQLAACADPAHVCVSSRRSAGHRRRTTRPPGCSPSRPSLPHDSQ